MAPIRLILSRPFEKLPAGTSCFWGNPDLPQGFDYPMYKDNEGDDYPYFFICQIRLEEVAPFDTQSLLPAHGLLLFFAKVDRYLGLFEADYPIGGSISDPEAVKVLYFPSCENMREVVLVDDNDKPIAPDEMKIDYTTSMPPLCDEHCLFAAPTHREWESWDHPYEDWEILLQIDSFEGMDFILNFMDFGVLDFLISPEDLKKHIFDNVRAIVLST